jgi:hypothetical protein
MFNDRYNVHDRDSQALPSPIVTAQRTYEFQELVKIYKTRHPEYVLEIGTWHGASLFHWLHNASSNAKIINIDLGPDRWNPPEPDFDTRIWGQWVPNGVELYTVIGNSQDPNIVELIHHRVPRIDFLWIDGDHSYEGVKADFQNYGPLVTSGVIALHDIIQPIRRMRINVCKLWREIQEAGYKTQEIYSMPNQPDMGIGIIYID